jgi:hypothetical protein
VHQRGIRGSDIAKQTLFRLVLQHTSLGSGEFIVSDGAIMVPASGDGLGCLHYRGSGLPSASQLTRRAQEAPNQRHH